MNGQYYVKPLNKDRAALWQHLFGLSMLQVLSPQPRSREVYGGSMLAYDMPIESLPPVQLSRFYAYMALRTGMDSNAIKAEIEGSTTRSIPIDAHGVYSIVLVESVGEDETAVSQHRRPFFFDWLARLFPPRVAYG